MRIAILGTGRFATDFGAALAGAGHDVAFGSRRPRDKGDMPGPILDHRAAVRDADVVVNALEGLIGLELLPSIADALAGAVVLDVSNAFREDGDLVFADGSVGERLQRQLPDSRVVKTLNNMAGYVAGDPASIGAPTTVFISGDDAAAKNLVGGLLASLGWPRDTHLDLGDIATSRATEHLGPLFWTLVRKYGTGEFNYRVVLAPSVADSGVAAGS